ncbi:PREDICTED: tyrosinase-like [Branchiostoma belcheri]|uniref:Tyrosinase n=1 Tax=Branchiostoma belcheri TaxID=7741 RepID=A0A6P4ZCR3_BRABE|nr:PREDICTED: tyrosinase-like [Branchiostoma belcheri]
MATTKRLVFVAVWLSLVLVADAQFPRACTDAVSFAKRECCPIPAGFTEPCGGAGRGRCVNFTDQTPTDQKGWPDTYDTDDRRRWPSVFFTRFCRCEGNFGWADCGFCKFGFYGSNCTETKLLTRKNVLNLTAEEKNKFVAYVNNTKYAQIQYVVASQSYVNSSVIPQFRNVSAYDYFVYLQHFVDHLPAAGSSHTSEVDFAHHSSGFATFNRAIVLGFERAVQFVNGDFDFALPYYDWTKTPRCNSSNVCSNDLLGATKDASGLLDDVSVFSRWETVCYRNATTEDKPCDVTVKSGPIVRKADGDLPTEEDVNFALRFTTFDQSCYDTASDCSFRNLLEGFVNTTTGIYDPNGNYLNARVHQSLGGTGGTMTQQSYAANDPIFFLHSCFLDLIFEKWMRKHNVAVEDALPESGAAPGHNRYENIVPFFPPFPHADAYKRSTELGYDYADIDSIGTSGRNIGPTDCPVTPPTTKPTTVPEPGGITGGVIAGFCVAAALGIAALGLVAFCALSNKSKPAP